LDLDLEVFTQLPHARIARLRFTEVADLKIAGLNEQNVLFNLVADLAADELWDVTLQSTHGLGGCFRCASIELLS
jgi:hypothetical protein